MAKVCTAFKAFPLGEGFKLRAAEGQSYFRCLWQMKEMALFRSRAITTNESAVVMANAARRAAAPTGCVPYRIINISSLCQA